MQRRKFVLGMGSLTAGGAAAIGSGAFQTVEAERQVKVELADDVRAYLGISGNDNYISDDSNPDSLSVNIGGATTANGGEGLNTDARTVLRCVNVQHNGAGGTGPVDLNLQTDLSLDGNDNSITASLVGNPTLTEGQQVEDVIEFDIEIFNGGALNNTDGVNDVGSVTIEANNN